MPIRLNLLMLLLCLLVFQGCQSKSEKANTETFQEKPATAVQTPDTLAKAEEKTEAPPVTENKPLAKLPPKICDPNFTAIGKAKSNHYFYYVTGFKLGEFKCWEELEKHGNSICQGQPCVIYYLDIPNVSINSTPPHYVDPTVLKEHGIGQFEHGPHWWESKGAKQLWGRPGKEYVYYNTNNNAGG